MLAMKVRKLNEDGLQKHIKQPPAGSVVVEITPRVAQFALRETNKRNRPISVRKIISYSKDMRSNNWSLTGETIKFGKDGLLKDGQHRLEACIRADTPFKTHACFGIDPEVFQHIDIGKKRDGSDTLAMMGVQNYGRASTIIKMIIAYEAGMSDSPKAGVSNDWLKRKYIEEIDKDLLQEAIAVANRVYKTTKWQTGVIGAFYYVAVQHGQREQIEPFFEDFCKGIGSKARSPIPFLLENVNRMRLDRSYQLRAHQYGIMLSRAYRNYKLGKASTKADVVVSLDDKMVSFVL
jgi:hypothetical protein